MHRSDSLVVFFETQCQHHLQCETAIFVGGALQSMLVTYGVTIIVMAPIRRILEKRGGETVNKKTKTKTKTKTKQKTKISWTR